MTAYNVFTGHLNDGAVEFLKANLNEDTPNLQTRSKKAQKFDTKLVAAKRKLIDFVNNLSATQSMPMEYLLQ